jgi:hypothetical protein
MTRREVLSAVAIVPPAVSCAREDSIAVRLSFITYTSWGVAAVLVWTCLVSLGSTDDALGPYPCIYRITQQSGSTHAKKRHDALSCSNQWNSL